VTILDDSQPNVDLVAEGAPPRRSMRLAEAAHRVVAGGGDLEALLVAMLGVGPLVRTDLVLAAITCRDESRRGDADHSWRRTAANLDLVVRMSIFDTLPIP
jgi:hypothetical protein